MNSWGIIVGRFQAPKLSHGHFTLIRHALLKHDKVLVFVGIAPGQPTARNPLDFATRKLMIQMSFPNPNIIILPLADHINDDVWSKSLDEWVLTIAGNTDGVLYGGRDNCFGCYTGVIKIAPPIPYVDGSGIEMRKFAASHPLSNPEFRTGAIYAITNRIASPYLCVDIAVIRENESVLLGKKGGESRFRFIGGFVESTDDSMQSAARREVMEEAGNIELADFSIIGETKINDWRYRYDAEKIFTVFFKCKYIFGKVVASDDMASLEWVALADLPTIPFMPAHEHLREMLVSNLNKHKPATNE